MGPRLATLALSAAVAAIATGGCGGDWEHTDRGEEDCKLEVESGVVIQFRDGQFFGGTTRDLYLYDDGRVVLKRMQMPKRELTTSRDEIARLVAEVRATGVLDEDEGCYDAGDDDDEVSDGGSPRFLALRTDDGRMAVYSAARHAPEEIKRAMDRLATAATDFASR